MEAKLVGLLRRFRFFLIVMPWVNDDCYYYYYPFRPTATGAGMIITPQRIVKLWNAGWLNVLMIVKLPITSAHTPRM